MRLQCYVKNHVYVICVVSEYTTKAVTRETWQGITARVVQQHMN